MVRSLFRSTSSLLIVLFSVRAASHQDPRKTWSVLTVISVAFLSLLTSRNVLQSYQLHLHHGHMQDAIRE